MNYSFQDDSKDQRPIFMGEPNVEGSQSASSQPAGTGGVGVVSGSGPVHGTAASHMSYSPSMPQCVRPTSAAVNTDVMDGVILLLSMSHRQILLPYKSCH